MVIKKINTIIYKLALKDNAILYTLGHRMLSIVTGIGTIAITTHYLNSIDLGYFYTFLSLISTQVLIELGLTYTITQFVAHEKAKLVWKSSNILVGNSRSINRLSSIISKGILIFIILSFAFFVIAGLVGVLFFSEKKEYSFIDHGMPWLILVLATSLKIIMTGFEGVLEGCDRVSEVALVRLLSNFIYSVTLWILIIGNFKLLAISIGSILSIILALGYYSYKYAKFIQIQFRSHSELDKAEVISWKKEIWPYQWRIAISWVSGYFLFQMYIPVVFRMLGPVDAGKLGIALSAVSAVASVTSSWSMTQAPKISALYSLNNNAELRSAFYRILISSTLAAIFFGGAAFIIFILAFKFLPDYSHKLPPLSVLSILLICIVINQYIGVMAIFARATKKEQYVYVSIVSASLSVLMLIMMTPKIGLIASALAYIAPTILIGIPFSMYLQTKIIPNVTKE